MTLSIETVSKATLSITAFSLLKLQLRTPSKITLTIATLSIENLKKSDNKDINTQP
jgi:hypothetical protein